ncbi:MAG: DUF2500 family protein [Cytophagaceae bacterium]|nr:MAG: DUF2500 family protein [Cytophagaceae bacterium]
MTNLGISTPLSLFIVAALCVATVVALAVFAHFQRISQPVQERRARVVAKRQDVSNDFGMIAVTTTYFVTFEFEGGDREERELKGVEYGQLAEGDSVMLATQGDALLSFHRSGQHERAKEGVKYAS